MCLTFYNKKLLTSSCSIAVFLKGNKENVGTMLSAIKKKTGWKAELLYLNRKDVQALVVHGRFPGTVLHSREEAF